MISMTQNLRIACHKFVQKQLPHEASLFDHVWDAFWNSLGCIGIEGIDKRLQINQKPASIRVLGAMTADGQELDTLFVLGAFVNTVASIQRTCPKGEVTVEIIADTLRRECRHIKTPDHLRSVLFGHGMGLLAGLLDVEVPMDQVSDVISAEQLWVEHCDKRSKRHTIPVITTGFFNMAKVDSTFRDERKKYNLFVDEFAPAIYLPQENKSVPWSDMQARHKKLLGIILEALPNRQPITLEAIFNRVFSEDHEVTFSSIMDGPRIRKALSELNHFLNGIFKDVIKAERSMNQYTVDGQITYCWIRPSDCSSRLHPS